jgi:hypothetical protein
MKFSGIASFGGNMKQPEKLVFVDRLVVWFFMDQGKRGILSTRNTWDYPEKKKKNRPKHCELPHASYIY